MKVYIRKYRLCITIFLVCVAVLVWALWLKNSFDNVKENGSEVMIERKAWYQLEVDRKPVLYYADLLKDSTLNLLSGTRDTTMLKTQAHGRWVNKYWLLPSCNGRIIVAIDSLKAPSFNLRDILKVNAARIRKEI